MRFGVGVIVMLTTGDHTERFLFFQRVKNVGPILYAVIQKSGHARAIPAYPTSPPLYQKPSLHYCKKTEIAIAIWIFVDN